MKYMLVEWKHFRSRWLYHRRENVDMQNHTIIFVDDDFICNLDICEILREADFKVVTTYCASAAFEAIATGGQLSGLVTDIDLGPGADGFEVARRARAA